MSDPIKNNNKIRYFTFYKWGAIACFVLSIVFLLVGIFQSTSGGAVIEALKPDFSNLSKDNPTSVNLQEAENIGVEYTERTGRRSTTTYNYFVIQTHNKKLILETDDEDVVKKDATINILNTISPIGAENQNNLKTLAVSKNNNQNTKLSEQELLDIKFVQHYTESDQLGADYWGWVVFLIFFVSTIVLWIRYWWDKRNYNIQLEDIKHHTSVAQNISQPNSLNVHQPIDSVPNSNFSNTYTPINHQNTNQNIASSTPVQTANSPKNQYKSNKTAYILLAIFLGVFGVHHFYNHKIIFGFVHLIWLVCLILPLFAPEQLALIFVLAFVLLPITWLVSLIQALMRGLSKE